MTCRLVPAPAAVASLAKCRRRPCNRSHPFATQPIELIDSQLQSSQLPTHPSRRRALLDAAARATEATSFESLLRDAIDDIEPPTEGSAAATVATTEAGDEAGDSQFEQRFEDNYEGIDWGRLPRYCKTGATQKHKKS
ncbi:hypothetical protein EK21DRAFT_83274, partial [Setomelanomma holmii]